MPGTDAQPSSYSKREAHERRVAVEGRLDALEASMGEVKQDVGAIKHMAAELRSGLEAARSAIGTLRTDLRLQGGRFERDVDELRASTTQRLTAMQGDVQAATHEIEALR